ncbi:class I SAM-dependent methyltransferase [Spiractinospora alimapuensis]|uniref:class I SAM-dependent methyltransferase n=1 Tax=Spiractinospora alimapuensis TaxID=2820884 RepID=UPI001F1920E4|nr:class I SAM-dependent methyltransferase [Spiractinospora alimapuensis]QVQ54161.1 class I SAM-dependent methyltransferase [Spiractinospora alimapuensis]
MSEPEYLEATRRSYDAVAQEYADLFRGELREMVFGRGFLGSFAEMVRAAGGGLVVDAGCGPGQVTALLRLELGLDAYGIDLSPEMVALARREHPEVRYEVGDLRALDVADGALAGLVSWFSFIHVPPADLDTVWAEFRRVLAPGGMVVLAFQVGDQPFHLDEAFGRSLDLDYQRWRPEHLGQQLSEAGFRVEAQLVSQPRVDADGPGLSLPFGYLMARMPD